MPSVFQSHPNQDEPQRLTTMASRASEDIALRPRRERDISVLYNQNNTATPEELSFQLNDHQPTSRASPARVSVSVDSILANSSHSSGEDAVQPVLEPVPQSQQLRTSTFTNLAGQLLNRVSTGSSASSNATNEALSAFQRSIIGSPEFDKISVDSMHVTHAPTTTDNGPSSTEATNPSSVGPSASARTIQDNAQRQMRARFSSDMSSLQHEMENNAYTTNSPVSEATYMQMRKTLDPEALLNGDARATGTAVHGSLRPIANPFAMAHSEQDFQSFQRQRAATTGTAPAAGPNFGAPQSFRVAGSNRSQRSWTVPANQLASFPSVAPVLLANDPRGTFRTTTADTTQQIFAAQQVRLQNKWQTDVWIYMKNSHPFLGICTAHRWHPYKKQDRILVLMVTLLVTVLLCGIFATQDCCKTSLDTSVAVVSSSTGHRLLLAEEYFTTSHREPATTRVLVEDLNCQPFGSRCGSSSNNLCTLGSTCQNAACVPTQTNASATVCASTAQCPSGWSCSSSSQRCRPSTSLVCYLPAAEQTKSRGVAFALTEDGETTSETAAPTSGSGSNNESAPVDAISALANLLKYADENNITTDGSTVIIPTPTPTTTPTPIPSATPTPTVKSNSTIPAKNQTTSASGDSGSGETDTTVTPVPTPSKAASADAFEVEKLLITLTKPTNGGVYGVSATIPIAWQVKLLQGQRSFVNALKFRVDFSRDGRVFDVLLASDIATDTPASTATDTTQYHYDWHLAQNESLTCTNCVLRVCTQSDDSSTDPVCIRTDGATSTSTRSNNGVAAASSAQPKITFHIVREIIECSCGLRNASFVTYAYLIALVFPFAFLVLEQLVTFYQDSKVFGMFARRGGPKMPVVGFYAAEATKRGRFLLGGLLLGLVFGCGLVGARITSANFMGSGGDVTVLWLVMVLLVLVIGFIYTSIVYIVLFTLRWNQDKELLNQPGDFADLNDFNGMMFLDNQDPQALGLSYQFPPNSIPTNSSRSNNVTDSSRSTAVVTQQPGLAMV